ncbi:MAG: hypothetical protein E6R03_09570, partial [Hyphomicrobiaceae bacterium]
MLHPQLITTLEVPRLLQVGEAQRSTGPMSEARVLAALNRAYALMTALAQQHEHPSLLDYLNVTISDPTSGLVDKSFPMRATALVTLSQRTQDEPTLEERNSVIIYRRNGLVPTSQNDRPKFEVLGRQIYVRQPRTAANYRLWFMKDMPTIHYGLVYDADSWAYSSVVPMRTSPTMGYFDYREDIYVGQFVYIYAGTGAGQMGRISSVERISADQYNATCVGVDDPSNETPFATTPLDDTSRYTILPWFPPNYYNYLAMETAVQFNMLDGAQLLVPTLE